MKRATVLIPTQKRVASLRLAVQSAQEQTLRDFEFFIVGDGVSDATRELVRELCAADDRIRFFDFEKAPGQGSSTAIAPCRKRMDASWLISAMMIAGCRTIWRCSTSCWRRRISVTRCRWASIGTGRSSSCRPICRNRAFRQRMLTDVFNRFDFTFAGHTLEAYRRLPYGWRTTPIEFPWTDLYMWRHSWPSRGAA